MKPRIEFVSPDGVQVLEGDAATTHSVLEHIVLGKLELLSERALGEPDEFNRRKFEMVLRKLPPMSEIPEPDRSYIAAALEGWRLMLADAALPLMITAQELPIVRAHEANARAAATLRGSMTENERSLDELQEVVNDLRAMEATLDAQYPRELLPGLLRRLRDDIETAKRKAIPGAEQLIAEMEDIHDRIRRRLT